MKRFIALGMAVLALSSQPVSAEILAAPETVQIATPDARDLPVRIWQPEAAPRGVVLFSHGFNSWPSAYETLVAKLNGEGLIVVAPLHPDSLRSSLEGKIAPQQAFAARIIDMQVASDVVGKRFEGLPVLAVGHSFGTLDAMVRAGGLPALSAPSGEGVSAILAFSTPGKIPGLVGDDAFSAVALPIMLVTGDDDTVPGFVADAADHRIYAERAAGPSYIISVKGGDHELVGNDAILSQVWPAVSEFIAAYLFDKGERPGLAQYSLDKPLTTQRGEAE